MNLDYTFNKITKHLFYKTQLVKIINNKMFTNDDEHCKQQFIKFELYSNFNAVLACVSKTVFKNLHVFQNGLNKFGKN